MTMSLALAERTAPPLASMLGALASRGLRPIVLRDGTVRHGASRGYRPVQLLVRSGDVAPALDVIDELSWRYAWVRGFGLMLVPAETRWWDVGAVLEVLWSLPAAPMPAWTLRRLTDLVWRSATMTGETLRPSPEARLAHLAVQACRPGRRHDADWADFLADLGTADRSRVADIAARAGVLRAVQTAYEASESGGHRPGSGIRYDGPLDLSARFMSAVQRHAAPHRFRRLLAGEPIYGDVAIRCRVAGVEVVADPGVFVPAPEAEVFVDVAQEQLQGIERPTVVEVGTGCGPVALALARLRPDATVHAAELSARAVASARRNGRRLGARRVTFSVGTLLEPVPRELLGRVDLVIANLPYIPPATDFSVGSVPRGTFQGLGHDGLGLQRTLARDARAYLKSGGSLQLQMLGAQWDQFARELSDLGYRPAAPRRHGAFVIGLATRALVDGVAP